MPPLFLSGTLTGKNSRFCFRVTHQALAVTAQAHGVSINELLNEGVDLVIEKHS